MYRPRAKGVIKIIYTKRNYLEENLQKRENLQKEDLQKEEDQ